MASYNQDDDNVDQHKNAPNCKMEEKGYKSLRFSKKVKKNEDVHLSLPFFVSQGKVLFTVCRKPSRSQ